MTRPDADGRLLVVGRPSPRPSPGRDPRGSEGLAPCPRGRTSLDPGRMSEAPTDTGQAKSAVTGGIGFPGGHGGCNTFGYIHRLFSPHVWVRMNTTHSGTQYQEPCQAIQRPGTTFFFGATVGILNTKKRALLTRLFVNTLLANTIISCSHSAMNVNFFFDVFDFFFIHVFNNFIENDFLTYKYYQ